MNITLIGMPGAGKTTVGRVLAQRLSWDFIDIDRVLEQRFAKPLQQILDEAGEEGFLKLEEDAVLSYPSFLQKAVVSTGGSIVYARAAMEHLKKFSTVVFLNVPLEEIKKRIKAEARGIVGGKHKTLEQIYEERLPLYKKYADLVVAMPTVDTAANVDKLAALVGVK